MKRGNGTLMATYEFKCCGITQEIISSIREQLPKPKCQICNGDMVRVYSEFGISFKGDGFYSTTKGSRTSYNK